MLAILISLFGSDGGGGITERRTSSAAPSMILVHDGYSKWKRVSNTSSSFFFIQFTIIFLLWVFLFKKKSGVPR